MCPVNLRFTYGHANNYSSKLDSASLIQAAQLASFLIRADSFNAYPCSHRDCEYNKGQMNVGETQAVTWEGAGWGKKDKWCLVIRKKKIEKAENTM